MLALFASVYHSEAMNSRQKKTLAAIVRDPVSGSIAWNDVENLLLAAGCRLVDGDGSRVRFEKDGKLAFFHCPHPEKEAKRFRSGMPGGSSKNWE